MNLLTLFSHKHRLTQDYKVHCLCIIMMQVLFSHLAVDTDNFKPQHDHIVKPMYIIGLNGLDEHTF